MKVKKRQDGIDRIFDILSKESDYDTNKFMELCFKNVSFEGYFKSSTGTYDESVASGSVKFIQNDSLRQALFDYYRDVKVNYTDNNAKKLIYEYLYPVYFKKFMASNEVFSHLYKPNRLPNLNLQTLGQDPEFIGVIMQKRASEKFQTMDWERYCQRAKSLRNLIDNSLSND